MAKKLRRKRIGPGVYTDRYGLLARVKVGAGKESEERAKRFPHETPRDEIKKWQGDTRRELERRNHAGTVGRGTFAADAENYLKQVESLISYKSRCCEVAAWVDLYGRLRRVHVTAAHVREARVAWLADGYAPKTINNRCQTLQHLFHVLDGKRQPTPVDDVDALPLPPTIKTLVPAETFKTVAENLKAGDAKTRTRFMVIAATGCRPSELKRTERGDVDLSRRLWAVRTGKGGAPRAIWLNDDMLAAWQQFIAADAWGTFDASDYAKRLYAAGWPEDVRPYQARHSVGITLGEKGVDFSDIRDWLGHTDVRTTRQHYVGVLASRLKRSSEQLADRFGWVPVTEESSGEAVH